MSDPQVYSVRWDIDGIHARTPREAAEIAQAIQRDPSSEATYFEVYDGSRWVSVDLDECTEAPG